MLLAALAFFSPAQHEAMAWDYSGQMTTASSAVAEIERQRPDPIDKIGLLMLTYPDKAPFWLLAGDAKGKERGAESASLVPPGR